MSLANFHAEIDRNDTNLEALTLALTFYLIWPMFIEGLPHARSWGNVEEQCSVPRQLTLFWSWRGVHGTLHKNLKMHQTFPERYMKDINSIQADKLVRNGCWDYTVGRGDRFCSQSFKLSVPNKCYQVTEGDRDVLSPLPTARSNASCGAPPHPVCFSPVSLWGLNHLPLLESGNQEQRKYKQEEDVECLLDAP